MREDVTPYSHPELSKKQQVAQMFNNIAKRYDFLNRFLSAGIDVLWRRKAIRMLRDTKPVHILDVATGTADFAIEALKTGAKKITGIDISEEMLRVGEQKIKRRNLSGSIELMQGDSESLPFESNIYDAVTVAFGVRNFEHLAKGLSEMYRVLKPGGTVLILEFSKPRSFPVKQLYSFYFSFLLPFFGRIISKDKFAYTYLPDSVKAFPDGEEFIKELVKAGFSNTVIRPLSFGIATIYSGKK